MPEMKSTLRVLNEPDLEWRMREDKQGTIKVLVGNDERPSERLRVHLNIFKAGAQEPVHWHLVEALYYVISGHAVLEDIEGQKHEVGPGSAIYYPPGIAGAHGWDFKEDVQLISIRATTDRSLQFSVDKSSMRSSIELEDLLRRVGGKFKSFY